MSCDYCDERKGKKTIFNTIYGDYNRVVYETKNFVVFPCMGQLREGHFLIASKEHINAVGMLDNSMMCELNSLVKEICGFIDKEYSKLALIFEHGVLDDSGLSGGCGIYHLHLHVIPVDDCEFERITEIVQGQNHIKTYSANDFQDTCPFVKSGKTYIFWGKASKDGILAAHIITNSDNCFESQYMRRVAGTVFGNANWDWKKIKNPELDFMRTYDRAKRHFTLL